MRKDFFWAKPIALRLFAPLFVAFLSFGISIRVMIRNGDEITTSLGRANRASINTKVIDNVGYSVTFVIILLYG